MVRRLAPGMRHCVSLRCVRGCHTVPCNQPDNAMPNRGGEDLLGGPAGADLYIAGLVNVSQQGLNSGDAPTASPDRRST
jgi:hypothetical protein